MPSPIQSRSFGSVRVFWLDSEEAIRRLRRAARRLLEEAPQVRAVYLFGSLAEGRAVPGSDADVLVILDRSSSRWFDRPLELPPVFDDVGLPVELFCYTHGEVERIPMARRALATGLPLAVREADPDAARRT